MATTVLQVAAALGFATTLVASVALVHRHLPGAYPREQTALDPQSYRVVRRVIAVGLPVGGAGAVLALVETLGSVRAADGGDGLLAGLAVLVPAWLGPSLVRLGVVLLVGAALLAGVVELRAARR